MRLRAVLRFRQGCEIVVVREGALAALMPDVQAFVSSAWTPRSWQHVGNVAWGRHSLPVVTEPQAAVFESSDETVAVGWVEEDEALEWVVKPVPGAADAVLDWFLARAPGPMLYANGLDSEPHLHEALARRGFQAMEQGPFFMHMWRSLAHLPEVPPLPAGFFARAVQGVSDLEALVAVHRAAWHPSRMTRDSYQAVMTAWPYQYALDWVIEAPDGTFAASALIWLDAAHGVGLLEPVGTHPAFRRLGLSRAVCLAALHALGRLGGQQAVVQPRGDDAYPIPRALYQSLGFKSLARTLTYQLER